MPEIDKNQNNDFSNYNKADWANLLKSGAYRGLKINRATIRLTKGDTPVYDKASHQLKLINDKGRQTINLDMDKLLRKSDRWSMARLGHNVKMWFPNSDYAQGFNQRMDNLADILMKDESNSNPVQIPQDLSTVLNEFVDDQKIDTYSLDEIKNFFDENSKLIDKETGDKEVQDNLFKLGSFVVEKFKDGNLAHEINSKAVGVMPPDFNFFKFFPTELQESILVDYLNALQKNANFGKKIEEMRAISQPTVDKWINDNKFSLKMLGCNNANDAIEYIHNHKLKYADFSGIKINADDLDLLHNKCPDLESLTTEDLHEVSFSGPDFSKECLAKLAGFTKLHSLTLIDYVDMSDVKKLTNLKSLSIVSVEGAGSDYPTDDLAKWLIKLTDLESFTLDGFNQTDKLHKAIGELTKIKSLNLSGYPSFKVKLAAVVEKLPLIEEFSFREWTGYTTKPMNFKGREEILNFLRG